MARYGYLLPTRGSVLTSGDAQTLAAKTAADVIGLAGRGEALGFDSVWVGDSVLAKPRHDPLSTLAALATATDSVGLGTAVHLPPLRHPVHVAHRTATVDQLAGGRLRWGAGVGSGPAVEAEYENLGVPYAERGARMDELLEVVTALWDGDPVDYDGTYYQLEDASIGFSPPGDLPIYIATSAFDEFPSRVLDRIATHADGWFPISLSPEAYSTGLETVRDAVSEADRSPDSVDPAFYLDVVIDDDEAGAIDAARDFYERYYPAMTDPSDEEVRTHGVFGTADAVAERIEAYQDAGVETLVVRFTSAEQRAQLQRFADLAL